MESKDLKIHQSFAQNVAISFSVFKGGKKLQVLQEYKCPSCGGAIALIAISKR